MKEKGKTKSEKVWTSLLFTFSLLLFTSIANAAELPAGYTQVEYIESTKGGGQYVDTEYTANQDTKVVMDAYIPPVEKQNDDSVVLFGTRSTRDESKGIDWSTKAFSIQLLGLKCIRFAYNGEYADSPNRTFDERITITCDKEKVAWTGGNPGSASVTVSPLAQSKSVLYIFGDNTVAEDGAKRDGAFNLSVMRLYSFQIYEGEELKRDFVPCVETATGRAGLYDTVEGKFHENKGSGEFLRPLPAGYTAVEYIESTRGGKQYIDTGIDSTKTLRATMDYVAFEHTGGVNLGSATDDDADWRYLDYSDGPLFDCGKARVGELKSENALALNVRYLVNVGTVGGTAYLAVTNVNMKAEVRSYTATCDGEPKSEPVTVFGGYEKDVFRYVPMRLYSLRIYEGEALVRNFVPCVEMATGRAGLYDTVEGKFHENKGSGAFGAPVIYCDPISGETKSAEAVEVTDSTGIFEDGKWYFVKGYVRCGKIRVDGSANLILCDGARLAVDGGDWDAGINLVTGNALTIWGQSNGTGELMAQGGRYGAGIGADYYGAVGGGGTVTINGGTVTATGGESAAGIGGGGRNGNGAGGIVTINGGMVTAQGGSHGAGIGGGEYGAGGTVTINGGTVSATGGYEGAGIGGTVTIDGGSVKAKIRGQPKNGKGDDVHCVTVEGEDGKLALEVLFEDYGMNDVVPIENKAYLWLADGTHFYNLNGVVYRAVVSGDEVTVTETPLRTASFILGKGVSNVSFTTDPAVTNGTATTDFALSGLPHGSRVFLDVGCADGYEYLGAKEFAVVAENMQVTLDAGIRLSDGYTAVAYIESTKGGGQYVDTGYKPKPERRFEIDSDPAITSIPDYSKFLQGEVAAVRGLKIYEGEKLVRDFVPCVETATGKAGLYDRVEGKYHGNAGSGELLTPLPWGYKRVNYIESTGGQYIDTGYVKTEQTRAVIVSDPAIGAVSDYSKFLQGASVRLYSFAIYEGEKLVRNFVPCVETATGEVGLCDVVRGVFHPNKGDGSFGYVEPCITAANFEQNRILRNGNTYRFAESIDYTAPDGESAMTVEDGATVTLFIPAGVTVTLTGGAADGQIGAGAGIAVPSGATLTICGAGTLNATGGKAANGASGKKGSDAGYLLGGTERMFAGGGGAGGAGGGGAGAGIGGTGGAGGDSPSNIVPGYGLSAPCAVYKEILQGVVGNAGNPGGAGGACGLVVVRGTVSVTAAGGADAAEQAVGGDNSVALFDYSNHGGYFYVGFSGGGGGGGGGGVAASDIGGGGGGGGSGGNGGSGGISWYSVTEHAYQETGDGYGGRGGGGSIVGAVGSSAHGTSTWAPNKERYYTRDFEKTDLDSAQGGFGGLVGSNGDNGTLTVASSARVNVSGTATQDPTIDERSIWAGSGDGWTFDPEVGTVRLQKNGLYVLTGDVTLGYARRVKLIELSPEATLEASGLPDIASLTTDGAGEVTGLYLIDGRYDFTLGDAVFSFTVGGSETEFAPTYSAFFTLGDHIQSVGYTTEPSVASGLETGDFTLSGLAKGTKIALDVTCDAEYGYVDAPVLTVGTENTNVALVAEHVSLPRVTYRDAQGQPVELSDVRNVYPRLGTIGDGGWYSFDGDKTIGTLTVSGTANLIIPDGMTVTVTGGVHQAGISVPEGATLVIWGGPLGTGELIARGGVHGAGIGGCEGAASGAVTIYGGVIAANGGDSGAGIGGGSSGANGSVTINGGRVSASGSNCGAGIGGGSSGAGGAVTISGGTVTATHTGTATDIGGGGDTNGCIAADAVVTITGGSVKAVDIRSQPKNAAGETVYCVSLGGMGEASVDKIYGLDGEYGMRDVAPTGGTDYFYLPDGDYYLFTDDGRPYSAAVNGGALTATSVAGAVTPGSSVSVGTHERDGWFLSETPEELDRVQVSGKAGLLVSGDTTVVITNLSATTAGSTLHIGHVGRGTGCVWILYVDEENPVTVTGDDVAVCYHPPELDGGVPGFGDVFGYAKAATPDVGGIILGGSHRNPTMPVGQYRLTDLSVTGYEGKKEMRGEFAIGYLDELGTMTNELVVYWYDTKGKQPGWYNSDGTKFAAADYEYPHDLGRGYWVFGAPGLSLQCAGRPHLAETTLELTTRGCQVLSNPWAATFNLADVTVTGYPSTCSGQVSIMVLDKFGKNAWHCCWYDDEDHVPAGWFDPDGVTRYTRADGIVCEPCDGWWVQGSTKWGCRLVVRPYGKAEESKEETK